MKERERERKREEEKKTVSTHTHRKKEQKATSGRTMNKPTNIALFCATSYADVSCVLFI